MNKSNTMNFLSQLFYLLGVLTCIILSLVFIFYYCMIFMFESYLKHVPTPEFVRHEVSRVTNSSKEYDAVLIEREHIKSELKNTTYYVYLTECLKPISKESTPLFKAEFKSPISIRWDSSNILTLVRERDDGLETFNPIWKNKVFIKLLSLDDSEPDRSVNGVLPCSENKEQDR